jgi:aminoglycoside 6'-N-acetyltransferase I
VKPGARGAILGVEIHILRRGDEARLEAVAADVFDRGIDAKLTAEFLADPRHHLVVAIDGGVIVGFASAVDYVHPDKPTELWINEVGVAESHRGRGIGKRIMAAMLEVARQLGCREAWVLTDRANEPAMRLYAAAGGTAAPRDQVMFTFRVQ